MVMCEKYGTTQRTFAVMEYGVCSTLDLDNKRVDIPNLDLKGSIRMTYFNLELKTMIL